MTKGSMTPHPTLIAIVFVAVVLDPHHYLKGMKGKGVRMLPLTGFISKGL